MENENVKWALLFLDAIEPEQTKRNPYFELEIKQDTIWSHCCPSNQGVK